MQPRKEQPRKDQTLHIDHQAGEVIGDRFDRDVQITREEFLRQLPDAAERRPFVVRDDIVAIDEGDGRVLIGMRQLPNAELGQLHLPMMKLSFRFENMSEGEIERFMQAWDVNTFRGGGM